MRCHRREGAVLQVLGARSFRFLVSAVGHGRRGRGLGLVSVTVDKPVAEWLALNFGWTFTGGAEGASALLGIVAGSMITIAGVVFSMTLVALSLASSQLGPRLLRSFMRDRATQVVLGTFIATFLYLSLIHISEP